jgi:hypothetical protein
MFRLLAVGVGLNGICAVDTRASVTKEEAGANATTYSGATRTERSNAVNLMVIFFSLALLTALTVHVHV